MLLKLSAVDPYDSGVSFWWTITNMGSRNSLLVKCRTRDQTVASSNPSRSGWRILFSRVNLVCWLLFGVRSTPVLPQWHVKDPGYSVNSAGGRLHLNTDTPFTQWSRGRLTGPLCRHTVGTYYNTSGNTRPQSSQLAEPLWTDHGLRSGRPNLHFKQKNKKKAQAGNALWTFFKNSRTWGKTTIDVYTTRLMITKRILFLFLLCS